MGNAATMAPGHPPQAQLENGDDQSKAARPATLNPLDMTEELYESAKASFGEELLQKCQYRYFNN